MINTIIFYLDKYSSLIALIALFSSFYSIYLTKSSKKINLSINYPCREPILDFYSYSFSIYNDSPSAVCIKSLDLLNLDNSEINIYNYNIDDYYDFLNETEFVDHTVNLYGNVFATFNPTITIPKYAMAHEHFSLPDNDLIEPHKSFNVVFFSREKINTYKISVISDKKLTPISKTKSFIADFKESNHNNYIHN